MKYILDGRFWVSWQNLNRKFDRLGNRIKQGSGFWHGRAWIHKSEGRFSAKVEWNFKSSFCFIGLSVGGDENDLGFHVALPPVAIWVSVAGIVPRRWVKNLDWWYRPWPKEVDLTVYAGSLWWKLWRSESDWMDDATGWEGNFNFVDFFLGRDKCRHETLYEIDEMEVRLKDGDYPVSIRIFRSYWDRPRWLTRSIVRATVTSLDESGVPTGDEKFGSDNNTISSTFPASTIREAVEKFCEDIEIARQRYGYYRRVGS